MSLSVGMAFLHEGSHLDSASSPYSLLGLDLLSLPKWGVSGRAAERQHKRLLSLGRVAFMQLRKEAPSKRGRRS